MNYTVYKITNTVNGKIYVGLTKQTIHMRLMDHYKRGFALTDAIHKYGKDKFLIESLETNLTKDQASEREKYYISELNSTVKGVGYNMTFGGDGVAVVEHTAEYRKKLSDAAKKNHANKIIGMHGRKHSQETKSSMSENHADFSGDKNPMYGRKHSPETIEKIRAARKNRIKIT